MYYYLNPVTSQIQYTNLHTIIIQPFIQPSISNPPLTHAMTTLNLGGKRWIGKIQGHITGVE